ncbi:hypothetical protein C8R47DRAFT_1115732 [Mycena vitilis]|nr:hypothetical protein C8R47DRAFT_1115732 [Mycena vitilis]
MYCRRTLPKARAVPVLQRQVLRYGILSFVLVLTSDAECSCISQVLRTVLIKDSEREHRVLTRVCTVDLPIYNI